jgi:hypothetical protein
MMAEGSEEVSYQKKIVTRRKGVSINGFQRTL